jgi:hypothetical protein
MILALLALLGAPSSADSPASPPEPLHPRDCHSADGRWVLHVDPSQHDGDGPADGRMTRSGALVWSRELPYTLREACVTNEGCVIGYAHSSLRPIEGELTLVILASDRRASGSSSASPPAARPVESAALPRRSNSSN